MSKPIRLRGALVSGGGWLMNRDGEMTNTTEQRESTDKKVRLVSTVEFYLVD